MSFGDIELFPITLVAVLFLIGLHGKSSYRWFFITAGIAVSVLLKFWNPSFLRLFAHSPILFGALFASLLMMRTTSKKYLLSAWILFMLPAYYWCKPLVNLDDASYLLRVAPALFQGAWGFLVLMGCFQVHRYRIARIAYLAVLMVFLLESQGQIILSYLLVIYGYRGEIII